jgi:hypothetical protein
MTGLLTNQSQTAGHGRTVCRGWDDLELDVLVQERPLPDQRGRSGARVIGVG